MHVLVAFLISIALFSGIRPIKDIPEHEVRFMAPINDNIVNNCDYYTPHILTPVEHRLYLKPASEFEFSRMAKQKYDYSCGSAALATILKYQLAEQFTETQIIHGMLKYGDKQKIMERRAFSLLDMKKFVNALGYTGVGYKASVEDLRTLDMPCIMPIELYGYRHFTVFKDIYKNHVFIADPFRGNTSYTIGAFKELWHKNVIFVIYPSGEKQLSLLEIKNEDLRFFDEDRTLDILLNDPRMRPRVRQQLPKEYFPDAMQYYKK